MHIFSKNNEDMFTLSISCLNVSNTSLLFTNASCIYQSCIIYYKFCESKDYEYWIALGEESRPGTAGTSLHQMLAAPASFSQLLKAEKLDLHILSSEIVHELLSPRVVWFLFQKSVARGFSASSVHSEMRC